MHRLSNPLADTIWQAQWAKALLDPEADAPDNLGVTPGARGAVGLAVHRNNVVAGLVDGLAATYDVVQQLVGVDFFRAMAAAFVRACPPNSPILAHYGGALPEYIRQFKPAASLPYLAEVAQLEWLRQEAQHAADAVSPAWQGRLLPWADLLQRDPTLQRTVGVLHPSLRCLSTASAALSLWQAHQAPDAHLALDGLDWAVPEHMLVWRPQWTVLTSSASHAAWAFVAAMQAGLPVADAEQQALALSAQFDAPFTLASLQRQGVLIGFATHLPGQS